MQQCFVCDPADQKLKSPYAILPGKRVMPPAAKFSVSIDVICVNEDYEGFLRGDNDILVMTNTTFGTKSPVQRIHAYEEELPTGKPLQNLLANNILLCDDFSPDDRLFISLGVFEMDTPSKSDRNAIVSNFTGLASTAGAVFPAVIPYTFAASAVIALANKVVTFFEKDTKVISFPLAFQGATPRPGQAPLVDGTYVVFARPTDPTNLRLTDDGMVEHVTPDPKNKIPTFAVLNVTENCTIAPQQLVNQEVATLVSGLKTSVGSSAVSAPFDFLRDTLQNYDSFKKLNRYLALKTIKDSGKGLTQEEQNQMAAIAKIAQLEPFLPN